MLIDAIRAGLYRAITTPRGDGFAPVRIPKDIARRINSTLGRPLGSGEELAKRRAASQKLAHLRSGAPAKAEEAKPDARPAAPVMVYFEKGRNQRELDRVKDTLDARAIPYTLLDVAGDEATLDFVMREAKCEADELPAVFVAGKAIGGRAALVAADASGELLRLVYGA
jgi:glutaredoxin